MSKKQTLALGNSSVGKILPASLSSFFSATLLQMKYSNTLQDDRKSFLKAGLMPGTSPQGSHLQVFPALPRTVVSLLFQQPQQELLGSQGVRQCHRGSRTILLYYPRQWLRPGQPVLALPQSLSYIYNSLPVLFA